MVTSINLGNFGILNGRNVLFGGASGLDVQSFIGAAANAKALPIKKLQDTIAANNAKLTALSQFQALLANYKNAANFLRNPPGVNNAGENIFKYVTSTITASDGLSGYVSITASPGATVQNYTIEDVEIALAAKQTSEVITVADADTSVVAAVPAADEFKAGTFTLKGVDITFEEGDSLNTIAAKLNAVKDTTGIAVGIVKVADGQYQLSFTGTKTGVVNDFDFNNLDPAGTLVDATGVFTNITITEIQDAADASFTLDGVTITSWSNSIGDAVQGLTFNLLKATPDDVTLDVTISPDKTLVKNGILNFLDAYNQLKIFATKQQELNEDGTYAATAILADSSVLRTTMNTLASQVATITSRMLVGDTEVKPAITFTDLPESNDNPLTRNVLTYDEALLDSILASDLEEVISTFEFTFTSTNPNLKVFSRTNDLAVSEAEILVNPFATQTTSFTVNLADPIVTTAGGPGLLKAGTITIKGQNIVLTDGMTAAQVEAAFDAVSGSTGVGAAVTGTDGNFQLVFTSTVSGGATNYDLSSTALDPTGVFDNVTIAATGVFQATYDLGGGPVTVNLTATASASGYKLEGPAGGPLQGLVLVYGGKLSSAADITMEQGIADKTYNNLANILSATGTLQVEADSIVATENKLNKDIARISEQVEKFREELLQKFAALEQVVASVNSLLQALDANDQARQQFYG